MRQTENISIMEDNSSIRDADNKREYPPFNLGYVSVGLNMLNLLISVSIFILSFRKNGRRIFQWKIVKRTVILASLCDVMFYGTQEAFGIQVLITREVPSPVVCSVYAALILEFAYAHCRLSTTVAFSAFYMLYVGKQIDFGKYDWKLLLIMFFDPAILLSACAAAGGMEFNGVYCGLKEGPGVLWNFSLIFIPLVLILLINLTLYFTLWVKIYIEGKKIESTIGIQSVTSRSIIIVSRKISFFLLVFVLRFTHPAVHGLWVFIEHPPDLFYQIGTFATCSGGLFNGLFYLTVYRNDL